MIKTILILDDDRSNLDVLAAILRSRNFHVTEASTGTEALAAGKHEPRIDLLVADVGLKGDDLSGTDVAVALNRDRAGLAIIFVTGTALDYWEEHDKANLRLLSTSAFEVLEKPFLPSALDDAVRRLESRNSAARVESKAAGMAPGRHFFNRM